MESATVPPEVLEVARQASKVTVLTGAGMSAESGVPTFRDAQSGLWAHFDPEDLATPQAWHRDRALVWAWYLWRVGLVQAVAPNAGHRALAEWGARPGTQLRIVTQNVDDLHERGGSEVLAHVHGSLFAFRCDRCDAPYPLHLIEVPDEPVARLDPPVCEACDGHIRPGVVWFGEALPYEEFRLAEEAVDDADLVLVVGTSGLVQPAASLPAPARARGIPVVEINTAPSAVSSMATLTWRATAATGLPALVTALNEGSTGDAASGE